VKMLPVGTTRDGRGSRRALLALALMVWLAAWGARQTRGAPAEAGDAAYLPLISRPAAVATTGSPALGIGFISSAEELADEQQYANAVWAGASWNRWPLYWSGVETAEGVFYWDRVDTAVRGRRRSRPAEQRHPDGHALLLPHGSLRAGSRKAPVERPTGAA
jgi:hypothetical protein